MATTRSERAEKALTQPGQQWLYGLMHLERTFSVNLTASISIESSQFKHICKGTNKGTKNKKAPRKALICLLTGGEGGTTMPNLKKSCKSTTWVAAVAKTRY